MDSTPPSDVPDPASPTPETTQPTTPPLPRPAPATGGPKVRSLPTPAGRSYRLPGTYAANFGGDADWRQGVTILWILFGLTAVGEIVRGLCCLFGELVGWPGPNDLVRIGLDVLVFVLLWLGWGWPRWVLVFLGATNGILSILVAFAAPQFVSLHAGYGATGGNAFSVTILPAFVLGMLYLATAGYLAFSANLAAFVRHRREAGRGWVVAPVAVLGALYLTLILLLPVAYAFWSVRQPALATRFGDETARRMAEHWDPRSIAGLGNGPFNQKWTDDFKGKVFASLARLGPLENEGNKRVQRLPTTFDLPEGGFIRQYGYELRHARFAHGRADIQIFIVKPLFRPWEIEELEMQDVHFDPAPPPTPTPAPAPAETPAASAPSPPTP